jgi:hypothetical protein
MLSAMTGLLYARISERRLVVDWTDGAYSDDGTNAFHRYFACAAADPDDAVPETDSVTPAIWQGHLRDTTRDVERRYRHPRRARLGRSSWRRRSLQHDTSIHLGTLDHDARVAVWWSYADKVGDLRPHFRGELGELAGMSTHEILAMLLREELQLRPDIRERVDRFSAERLGGRTVGVHLRLSDRRVRVPAILAALDALLKREPDLKVFGATDSVEAKELLERRYPGVIMTPHWYPPPGTSLHQNRACPDRLENGVEALVDMYLLGGCDHLVGDTASSFTRIARLLMADPERQMLDVKPPPDLRGRFVSRMRRRHPRIVRGVYRVAGLSR